MQELLPRRPELKLLLMSATVNEHAFSKYFNGCPALSIPGFTHPVKEYYMEDVLSWTRYFPSQRCDCLRKPLPKKKGQRWGVERSGQCPARDSMCRLLGLCAVRRVAHTYCLQGPDLCANDWGCPALTQATLGSADKPDHHAL